MPKTKTPPRLSLGTTDASTPLTIDPESLAGNLAVIAGSGSGKSSLIALLIEELLLKTSCRCVIIDPNSDYLCLNIPSVRMSTDVEKEWKTRKISVRSALPRSGSSGVNVPWGVVSMDFLSDHLPNEQIAYLRDVHTAFCALCELYALKALPEMAIKVSTVSKEFLSYFDLMRASDARPLPEEVERQVARRLDAKRPTPDDLRKLAAALNVSQHALQFLMGFADRWAGAVMGAARAPEEVRVNYVNKLNDLLTLGIVCDEFESSMLIPEREESVCEAVDIASIPDRSMQRLAVAGCVAAEWARATVLRDNALSGVMAAAVDAGHRKRKRGKPQQTEEERRTPTFIIVDEAHNFIPNSASDSRPVAELKELFRRIVAEGRKYFLHLIVVTQRPGKLDPFVLSECQNLLVMRCDPLDLGSSHVLDARGVLKVPGTKQCSKFKPGQGIIIGPWAANPQDEDRERNELPSTQGRFELPRTELSSPGLPSDAWMRKGGTAHAE